MALASNPRAVVTGGGSGIGRAFCVALAKRGGRVLVADVNLEGAEETASLVRAHGGKAEVTRCDVASKEQVFALPALMKEKFGGTDVVFNNAGVAVGGLSSEVPLQDWEWLMGINLWGVIHGCLAFMPEFRERKSGHFVNVASAAGLICGPRMAAYNVSKAGVVALSETFSVELGKDGIGVTVLCPSFIRTNIHLSGRTYGTATKETLDKVMARAKKTPDEIAEITLRAADRNQLYVVPHREAYVAWIMKRLDPEHFYKRLVTGAWKRAEASGGAGPTSLLSSLFGKLRKND
jgi:NAD(P)-dependent dehydrogenase (short-subunit alcohol dehydrogenase family)